MFTLILFSCLGKKVKTRQTATASSMTTVVCNYVSGVCVCVCACVCVCVCKCVCVCVCACVCARARMHECVCGVYVFVRLTQQVLNCNDTGVRL